MKFNKILVVRSDRFGEFLLNIPAIRAIREAYPNAEIILFVNSSVVDLARCLPYVDEILECDKASNGFLKKLRFINSLKKFKFDAAVMLNPSKDFNIVTFLAGIPVRAGYDRKWGFLLNRKIMDNKHLGLSHEVEYNLELVSLIGAKTDNKAVILDLDMHEVDKFAAYIGIDKFDNLVAIHPWTSDPLKQWSQENFRLLAKRLIDELKLKILIVGTKDKIEKSKALFGDLGNSVFDITGKTGLRELAWCLKKCRLLISADSGPVHLASAVGTPAIALFRNDIPGKCSRRWGPWGDKHIVIEKPALSAISVDEVFLKAKEALKI
ncbi:MAG: glycosyltransferase family 9 protein [Candidatus Omnitrophica bacterium]|nr:glycosyltransferase family 9 protein [Candidatus Omnitrophota bacterium]